MGEFQELQGLASEIGASARAEGSDVGARAERVAKRLAEGRFHVAVLGEFKRGKSTLVNALLGAEVLPTGVLPLTAVVTEVVHGEPGATVVDLEGRCREIELSELVDFVSESGNPANERRVDRVEVRWPAGLLATGVVLVDTPGIGSIHRHNTEAGLAALLEADGAVLVLSVDEPLSEGEFELLEALTERRVRTFIVVNKADHLPADERERVIGFIEAAIADRLGMEPELFCVAARAALTARGRGDEPGADPVEWDRFAAAFEHFIDAELVDAQLAAARAELGRVAEEFEGCGVVASRRARP